MPRKGYSTLTLKNEAYERFLKVINKAQFKDRRIHASEFLHMLLDMYEKNPDRIK